MRKRLLRNLSIKQEAIFLFIPNTILAVICIGAISYYLLVQQVQTNARNLIFSTVQQTKNSLDDQLSSILLQFVSISNNLTVENLLQDSYSPQYPYQKYNDLIALNSNLNITYQNNYQALDSIYFCFDNTEYYVIDNYTINQNGIHVSDWINNNSGFANKNMWQWLHKDTMFETQNNRQVVSIYRKIKYGDDPASGFLIFNLRKSFFDDVLDNAKVSNYGYMMLVNDDNTLKSQNIAEPYQLKNSDIRLLEKSGKSSGSMNTTSAGGKKVLIVYKKLSVNNWFVVAVVPEMDLLQNATKLTYIETVIIILVAVISSLLAIYFAKCIVNPIEYLSNQVQKFDNGDMNVEFQVNETNEIGVLANALSNLRISVSNLFEEVQVEQEKKAKIEFLSLQSQIKPHFLYNTLASIKQLIEMNNNDLARQMCEALVQFYKIGISSENEIITIKSEIEHVRNYLQIQKIRYGDNINFEINIDDEILNQKIMKLTLQPIVENSIYHGLKCKKKWKGIIIISGSREDDHITLEIYDDGVGMSREKLSSVMASIQNTNIKETPGSFGLRNLNQRLILNYGKKYGLSIESAEHVYTKVTVTIPYEEDASN